MTEPELLHRVNRYVENELATGEFASITQVAGALDLAPQDLMFLFSLEPGYRPDFPDNDLITVGRCNGVFGLVKTF